MTGRAALESHALDRVELAVAGTPRGKGRPRFVRATGRAHTDARTERAEADVRLAWIEQGPGAVRFADYAALRVEVDVILERPRGHFRTNGELGAAGLRAPYPTRKPDADNVAKLVVDSLNRVAYRDDAQVVELVVRKRWGDREQVRVVLERLNREGEPV